MDVLDSLMTEALGQQAEAQGKPLPADRVAVEPYRSEQAIKKLRYTHDAMIDLIIASPGISQNQLALSFGYTPSWISQVIASDAFQSKLAERRKELVDPAIAQSVDEHFRGLVFRSMELLKEKLDRPASVVPDNLVLRTLEVSARALGYGAKDTTIVKNEINIDAHLDTLGSNLTKLLQRKKAEAATDAEIIECAPST